MKSTFVASGKFMLIISPFELSELCTPGFEFLHGKTRGSYTLEKVKSCLGNQQLDLSKRLNVCTNGAPSMTGKAAGVAALLECFFGLFQIIIALFTKIFCVEKF